MLRCKAMRFQNKKTVDSNSTPKSVGNVTSLFTVGRVLVLVLALVVMFAHMEVVMATAGSGETSASRKTANEITSAKNKRAAVNKKLSQAKKRLAAVRGETKKGAKNLAWLQRRSELQRKAYEEALEKKNAALEIMEMTSRDYEEAVLKYETQKEKYGERLALMYRLDQKSIFEIFLSSGNLQNYFSNNRLMRIISDTDEYLIKELDNLKNEAERLRKEAEDSYADMEKLVAEADELLKQIQADAKMSRAELNKAMSSLAKAEKAELQWAREAQYTEREIKQLQKKYEKERTAEAKKVADAARKKAAKSKNKNKGTYRPSPTGWNWPLPGHHYITSRFGYRIHPVTKRRSFHYGVDIAAGSGTPIRAPKSGLVLQCAYNGISGYYIVVDHGRGYSTVYRHLKKGGFACRPGQSVKAGQVIGYVGTTGRSTGPHLHFEIRYGGQPKNPLAFY